MDVDTLIKEDGTFRLCKLHDATMALSAEYVTHLSRTDDGVTRVVGMRKSFVHGEGYRYTVEFASTAWRWINTINTYGSLGPARDDVVAFLNWGAHEYRANDAITYWSNQAHREATVLAVIEDEIILEYEMPAGTSALVKCNVRYGDLRGRTNYSYNAVPRKWLMAILGADMTNWIGMGQRSIVRIPFPIQS